ncbi:Hexosyltransferase [Sarracenia purpurea var. burkii]
MEKHSRRPVFGAVPMIFLLLLTLLCIVVFRSNIAPFDQWKQQLSNWSGLGIDDREHLSFLLRRLTRGEEQTRLEATGLACHSDRDTDVCVTNGPVRIDTRTLKVYAPFSHGMPQSKHTIRPYARKRDQIAMSYISPVQILQGNITPPACHYNHNDPAIVFSSGGYSGNMFHGINDVIIPLFITSRHFQSRLHFVVTNFRPSFLKYNRVLSHLSENEAIHSSFLNGSVHCFPGAVVGLRYHGNLALNASDVPGGYSMPDFKKFLREAYNMKTVNVSEMEKPVLILVSRTTSRVFLNEDEMVSMMEELGFRVIVAMPQMMSDLDKFTEVLSSCSVLVGAHGAGLTNAVFLPPGAVLVQVVPLALGWVSRTYFGGPAAEMGLQYLEYIIQPEESSLLRLYSRDDPVITNPGSIWIKAYQAAKDVYLDKQNLDINIVRFRGTLVKALGLLGRSAPLA